MIQWLYVYNGFSGIDQVLKYCIDQVLKYCKRELFFFLINRVFNNREHIMEWLKMEHCTRASKSIASPLKLLIGEALLCL